MKKVLSILGLLVMLVSVLIVSCTHELPTISTTGSATGSGTGTGTGTGSGTGSSGSTCSVDTVYFNKDIEPLIISGCAMAGCHDAITKAEGVVLNSYANISKYVSPGKFSSSKLYTVLVKTGNSRMPEPPLPAFNASQLKLVEKWITQGAKNNACFSCDSSNFKYSTAIQPLLQTKCIGCHSTASPGGGIDLSSYTLVKNSVTSGRFWGSINQDPGFSPMPKGMSKMSVCELTQFKKWIDAGALNN